MIAHGIVNCGDHRGALIVITVAAVILAGMADDREASAKLDLLCAEFVKARDENIVLAEALRQIASGHLLEREAVAEAQKALRRTGRTVRKDRDDITPQPGRFNA